MRVKTLDTGQTTYEVVKRQLRDYNRKIIGDRVITDGAANTRRHLPKEKMLIGDVKAQERAPRRTIRRNSGRCRKSSARFASNIFFSQNCTESSLDDLYHTRTVTQLQWIVRFLNNDSSISVDATGSLVNKLEQAPNISSPLTF